MKITRCERCKKNQGTLYEVTVTSGGKTFTSLAHKDCAKKWSKVSQVILGEVKYQLLIENNDLTVPKIKKKQDGSVLWQRQKYNQGHRCFCGKIISPDAERCREHEHERRRNIGKIESKREAKQSFTLYAKAHQHSRDKEA